MGGDVAAHEGQRHGAGPAQRAHPRRALRSGRPTNATLYVGTDLGIYRTKDGGNTWERFGRGMPMVKVTDLFIEPSGALMRAATFGRGLWEISPERHGGQGRGG